MLTPNTAHKPRGEQRETNRFNAHGYALEVIMKCKSCGVDIPGENGPRFYGTVGCDGVECEKCAVDRYKKESPFGGLPVVNDEMAKRGKVVDPGA